MTVQRRHCTGRARARAAGHSLSGRGRTALEPQQGPHGVRQCRPPGGLLLREAQEARAVGPRGGLDGRAAADARRPAAGRERGLSFAARGLAHVLLALARWPAAASWRVNRYGVSYFVSQHRGRGCRRRRQAPFVQSGAERQARRGERAANSRVRQQAETPHSAAVRQGGGGRLRAVGRRPVPRRPSESRPGQRRPHPAAAAPLLSDSSRLPVHHGVHRAAQQAHLQAPQPALGRLLSRYRLQSLQSVCLCATTPCGVPASGGHCASGTSASLLSDTTPSRASILCCREGGRRPTAVRQASAMQPRAAVPRNLATRAQSTEAVFVNLGLLRTLRPRRQMVQRADAGSCRCWARLPTLPVTVR